MAVVIALLGLVGAAVGSAVLHQQRFYADASELLYAREGVRDAMGVLSTDIRGSSSGDTLRLMADTAIELFASIGTSVVCRSVASNAFALAAESGEGNTLTSLPMHPDTGDIALLYIDSDVDVDGDVDSAGRSGSVWERQRIAAFAAKPAGSGCLLDGTAPAEGFVLTLQSNPAHPVRRGAPVRFVRRGRFSLYRSSDRQWYLGYRRCNALGPSSCGTIQPISGPYRSHSADREKTGFMFEYLNARGEGVSGVDSSLAVARIDITARTDSREARRIGKRERSIGDSATTSVAIRNR